MELAYLLRDKISHGLVDNRPSPASTRTIIHDIRQNLGFWLLVRVTCWGCYGNGLGVVRGPEAHTADDVSLPVPQRATVC